MMLPVCPTWPGCLATSGRAGPCALILSADFVCRLLKHMKAKGERRYGGAAPEDEDMPLLRGLIRKTSILVTSCAACTCCPSAVTSPNGSIPRILGEKDAFPAIDLDDRAFVYETIEHAKADAAVAGD